MTISTITQRFLMTTAILAAALVPGQANADWLLSPFVGGNIGGATVKPKTNFGISAAMMGAGAIGWEFDAGWAPDFFKMDVTDDKFRLINKSSASTYMVNAIVGAPVGGQSHKGVRPYGSAGVGAIRVKVESDLKLVDIKNTDIGWNVGAGAMGFFDDHWGVRGDARYFRSFQNDLANNTAIPDAGRFAFWRITGGVVLRYGPK
jgi:hypothetical protein